MKVMKKTFYALTALLLLAAFFGGAAAAEERGLGHYDIGITIPSVQSTGTSSAYTAHVYSANIPTAYDLRDIGVVTPVKDQGKYGSCWAFSVINALESNAIMQGFENTNTADFSELQLLYFYYNRDGVTVGEVLPEFAGLAGDNVEILTGDSYLEAGGNIILSARHLSTGMGIADEVYAPYSLTNPLDWDNTTVPPELDPRLSVDYNRYILSNVTYLSLTDSDLVKQYLIDVGCGAVAYYQDDTCVNISGYQGKQSTSYFQNEETSTNHCVSLVGWDDNYPRENFLIQPAHDGAWLVKNSWGEEWGDDGYFWISYEDASLSDVVFYEVCSADKYDSIYQYDGSIGNDALYFLEPHIEDGMSMVSAMNMFIADDNEIVTHVSFETQNTHVNYAVMVMNESDESMSVTEGVLVSPGYYTVELTAPVYVQKGEIFAAAVAFAVSDDSINVNGGTELMMPVDRSYTDSSVRFTSVSNVEESMWYDGVDYVDAYDMQSDVIGEYNFRIKAFAVDADTPVSPLGVIAINEVSTAGEYIGSDVMLSGTGSPNEKLYFYVTDSYGYVPFRQLKSGDILVNTTADENGDWSIVVPGSAFYTEAGVVTSGIQYQIYAAYVSSVESLDVLISSSQPYADCIVNMYVPYITAGISDSIESGESVVVNGCAYGADSVIYYLFDDYDVTYEEILVNPDGYFEFTIPSSWLYDGQYWLVIQHPMYDGRFNINPCFNFSTLTVDFVLDLPAGNLTNPVHLFNVPEISGVKAADSLLDALSELNSMDVGLYLPFFVGDVVFEVDTPIYTVTQGSLLTIKGTTTAPVGTNLTFATGVNYDGYVITEHDTGYTEVKEGVPGSNVWSVYLDTTTYNEGDYIFGIVLTDDTSVGCVAYFTVNGYVPIPTPDKPEPPVLNYDESLPDDATETTNTVAETNAATKAEVGYQVKPTDIAEMKAPTITRGSLSVMLNDAVKVMKKLSDGSEVEVEATVNEDGSIS
ncbi:MAG: hypothetical protein IJB12_01380, partial [Methanocorpusculum sp.]|nr:hypothetical protein [Methanocorpusculum sp.]